MGLKFQLCYLLEEEVRIIELYSNPKGYVRYLEKENLRLRNYREILTFLVIGLIFIEVVLRMW